VKNDSIAVHQDDNDDNNDDDSIGEPTSIEPVGSQRQRPVLDAGDRALDSKWSDNQYRSRNNSAERRDSVPPGRLINSQSDERIDDVFPNKNHSENNHSLSQPAGL